jgi:CBS-domain-containing membrane protein
MGSLPSVPDEFARDVLQTSWSIVQTNPDPTLVVRAVPGQFITGCPSCHNRLVIDVIRSADPGSRSLLSSLRHVTCIVQSTPLAAAAELLASSVRRMLAVVDHDRRLMGVLSPSDVLAAARDRTRDELSTLTAQAAVAPTRMVLRADTALDAAMRAFVRDDSDYALVVDEGGRVLGVLLATDVLAAYV